MSKVRKTSIPVQSITEPSHTLLSYLKTVGSPLPFDENFADKSIEIFLGHQPYDHLRNLKLQQGNSIVVCLTQEELHSIWRSDLYGGADVAAISNWLIGIGQHRQAAILSQVINFPEVAEKTAFSIECCEGIQRINGSQLKTLCEIVNTLLESGCNVSMADFALDVVNKLFKEIGLPEIFKIVEQDVSGNIQLDFNPNALSEIPNGQISMLGNLAEAGKTMIHTLGSTRRPVLHLEVSPLVKVYSVATKAGRPKNEQLVCIDPLNGQWAPGHSPKDSFTLVGTPVIMIINDEHPVYKSKNWKGNVVLFAAHFSEIKSVDGISEDALSQMIGEVEGEEAVQEYKQKLSSADASAKSRLMQEFAYNCVQSAPQCKKKYTKTSSKW